MAEETRTHWKQLVDPRYLGAYSLPNGNDMVVTIERVQSEEVTVAGGKKEDLMVMYLAGQKPMILNSTNATSIQHLYGAFIENWAGKQVTLYASTARLGHDLVECLRIRPAVPVQAKKGIGADRLARALEQIRVGSYTLDKLRTGFALTPAQRDQVNAFEESLPHE